MSKFFFISIFCITLHGAALSQIRNHMLHADSTALSRHLQGNFRQFNMDALGNLFVINESGQIKKIDLKGDSSQVFQDVKKWGRPEYLDVSNPLKIRIFYPDFITIVTLDRLLNPRNTLNLRKKNHFRVNGVGTSYDNHLWIYDEQLCRIFKLDDEGNVLLETADLRNLIEMALSNVRLYDRNGDLFLFDEKYGMFIFDYYGAFKKQIPEMTGKNSGVDHEFAYVLKGEKLQLYHLKQGLTTEISVNGILKENESFVIASGTLYILKSDGIYRCPLK